MNYTNFLTIDPGTNIGWALWENSELHSSGNFKLKSKTIEAKISEAANKIDKLDDELSDNNGIFVDAIYIESVGLWGNTERSQISAAKGNTFEVAYIVGAIIQKMKEYYDDRVHLIDPRKWKGNMNKQITSRRVEKALGRKVKNEHECDAIGIGLSLLGKL